MTRELRTSPKIYYERPNIDDRAARYAWDWLAARGSMRSLQLRGGLWHAMRHGGDSDCVSADAVTRSLREISQKRKGKPDVHA